MYTKTMSQFDVIDENMLAAIEGGDRNSYCNGLIAGRLLRKALYHQPVLPSDFICKEKGKGKGKINNLKR